MPPVIETLSGYDVLGKYLDADMLGYAFEFACHLFGY
jgi:hypothetical protein